jgi:hypothetical protein
MSTVSLQARQEFLEYCQQNPSAGSCGAWEVVGQYLPALLVVWAIWFFYTIIITPKGKLFEKIKSNILILLFVGGGLLVITEITNYGFALMALGILLFHLDEARATRQNKPVEKI